MTQAAGGWQVTLDARALRTVGGAQQIVPSKALAEALAQEWDAQGEKIDPKSMPLRDMVDYAVDVVAADPAAVITSTLAYGDTDTLLYRADPDEAIYAQQIAVWEPIVARFEADRSVQMVRVSGIVHRPQSPETLDILRGELEALSPYELAATQAMASLAASLVIALSVKADKDDPEALWQAASLEEEWQADEWGRDEEAEERRAKRARDFLKSCEMLRLARG